MQEETNEYIKWSLPLCPPPFKNITVPVQKQEFTQIWAFGTFPVQEKLYHHVGKWNFSPGNILNLVR